MPQPGPAVRGFLLQKTVWQGPVSMAWTPTMPRAPHLPESLRADLEAGRICKRRLAGPARRSVATVPRSSLTLIDASAMIGCGEFAPSASSGVIAQQRETPTNSGVDSSASARLILHGTRIRNAAKRHSAPWSCIAHQPRRTVPIWRTRCVPGGTVPAGPAGLDPTQRRSVGGGRGRKDFSGSR